MFFNIHEEKKIGLKKLSEADLGKKETSNQTHIGLYNEILTFLPNNDVSVDALFIYEDNVKMLTMYFDRIKRKNSKRFQTPKIKSGGYNSTSIVTRIREITQSSSNSTSWYLFWLGLENELPVFYLINNNSDDFNKICDIGVNLNYIKKEVFSTRNPAYDKIFEHIKSKAEGFFTPIQRELEIIVQTKEHTTKNRNYDIEKAREKFERVGKEGEKLIFNYLKKLQNKNIIKSFYWENEIEESYKPYDFKYETMDSEIFYLDVKTTSYDFEQKIIFSGQEILFGAKEQDNYEIFRVYSRMGKKCLRICKNSKSLLSKISVKINKFQKDISDLSTIENIKISILPKNLEIEFGSEIELS